MKSEDAGKPPKCTTLWVEEKFIGGTSSQSAPENKGQQLGGKASAFYVIIIRKKVLQWVQAVKISEELDALI